MVTWLWVLVRGGADCAWEPLVSYGGFGKNFLFWVACFVTLFAIGNLDVAFALVSFSLCSGEWVLLVEYNVWIILDACAAWFNSGYMFYGRLWTIFSMFYVAVNSNPEAFVLHSV